MTEAKRRLLYTMAPVDRIAYQPGYKGPGYFSRRFKLSTGLPPGEYRQRQDSDSIRAKLAPAPG